MAALGALVVLLGAMFAGAWLTDRWRTTRLQAWASGAGFRPVDQRHDGGALIAHARRFAPRVRSFGLAFERHADGAEVRIAEHRARTTTTRAEKWHTLVVVQVPGADFPELTTATLDGWPYGGDLAVDGDVVRWRRVGLLWPSNAAETVSRAGELVARLRDQRLGMVQ